MPNKFMSWLQNKLNRIRLIILVLIGVSIGFVANQIFQEEPTLSGLIDFPITANTLSEKFEYAYAAQEKLRLEHNVMGAKFRNGVITKNEWEDYLEIDFNPLNNKLSYFIAPNREAVMKELLATSTIDYQNELQQTQIYLLKQQFKKSTRWTIDTKALLK